MNYKVGDKVRIIKREGQSDDYPYCFTDQMQDSYSNEIATIVIIIPHFMSPGNSRRKYYNGDNHVYILDIDKGAFSWHSSMFRKAVIDTNFISIDCLL